MKGRQGKGRRLGVQTDNGQDVADAKCGTASVYLPKEGLEGMLRQYESRGGSSNNHVVPLYSRVGRCGEVKFPVIISSVGDGGDGAIVGGLTLKSGLNDVLKSGIDKPEIHNLLRPSGQCIEVFIDIGSLSGDDLALVSGRTRVTVLNPKSIVLYTEDHPPDSKGCPPLAAKGTVGEMSRGGDKPHTSSLLLAAVQARLAAFTGRGRSRFFFAALLDSLFGLAMIWMLGAWTINDLSYFVFDGVHSRFFSKASLSWLSSSPFGFKLNDVLAKNMAEEMRIITGFITPQMSRAVGYLSQGLHAFENAPLISIAVGMGASGLLRMMFDIVTVLSLPLYMVHVLWRHVFRSVLSLLGSLQLASASMKRNPLRSSRVDSYVGGGDMELVLAVSLQTVLVFLFTTCLAFHAFCTGAYICTLFMKMPLWVLAIAVEGSWWVGEAKKNRFVKIAFISHGEDGVLEMRPVCKSWLDANTAEFRNKVGGVLKFALRDIFVKAARGDKIDLGITSGYLQ